MDVQSPMDDRPDSLEKGSRSRLRLVIYQSAGLDLTCKFPHLRPTVTAMAGNK
jgi:hypothetical protein